MCTGDPKVQSNRSPDKPSIYCKEARRLLDAFGQAVHELVQLHEQQFLAIVAGDSTANRFDLLIHDANEKKQNSKYAYMTHLDVHGCSTSDEINVG
jgi:hypothetical protein